MCGCGCRKGSGGRLCDIRAAGAHGAKCNRGDARLIKHCMNCSRRFQTSTERCSIHAAAAETGAGGEPWGEQQVGAGQVWVSPTINLAPQQARHHPAEAATAPDRTNQRQHCAEPQKIDYLQIATPSRM